MHSQYHRNRASLQEPLYTVKKLLKLELTLTSMIMSSMHSLGETVLLVKKFQLEMCPKTL